MISTTQLASECKQLKKQEKREFKFGKVNTSRTILLTPYHLLGGVQKPLENVAKI